MKRAVLLIFLVIPALSLLAQEPDAISGATLKPEYLTQYLNDPAIRAIYNSDPYDNQPVAMLDGGLFTVDGEIMNPGLPSIDGLILREVVVKELVPGAATEKPEFMGAFKYQGYSLADLLRDFVIEKANKEEFGLNHDLYIVVENREGESAVFSWGEIFNSQRGRDIIMATGVSPVFPTSSDNRWEVPRNIRIVAGNDYMTVRNIENPSRITIYSFPESFSGTKGSPLYSPDLTIYRDGKVTVINDISIYGLSNHSLKTVFFGLHKGFRRLSLFTGASFGDVIEDIYKPGVKEIKSGIIAIGAKDGYRAVYSVSEIINRCDIDEVLIIDGENDEDGRFMIFPASDFFADRFMKGANTAYIKCIE